jgi:hypothetical protein
MARRTQCTKMPQLYQNAFRAGSSQIRQPKRHDSDDWLPSDLSVRAAVVALSSCSRALGRRNANQSCFMVGQPIIGRMGFAGGQLIKKSGVRIVRRIRTLSWVLSSFFYQSHDVMPFERGIAVSGGCFHANHFYCLAGSRRAKNLNHRLSRLVGIADPHGRTPSPELDLTFAGMNISHNRRSINGKLNPGKTGRRPLLVRPPSGLIDAATTEARSSRGNFLSPLSVSPMRPADLRRPKCASS